MPRNKANKSLRQLQADLVETLVGKDIRLHISNRQILDLKPEKTPYEVADKPEGFWYDVGADWLRYCTTEFFWLARYVYEVKLDLSRILRVRTIRQFNAFEKKYRAEPMFVQRMRLAGIADSLFDGMFEINWAKVAENYPGVEIAPYLWQKRLSNSKWYYSWDVASGVIWDIGAVKGIDLHCWYDKKSQSFKRAS